MYEYFHISAADLGKDAKVPVLKLGDSGEVFYEIAMEMVNTIKANNAAGKHTVFICPVGPVGQYPIFVRLVNRDRISLKNCWFINMDEYLNDDGSYIDIESPLSFRGFMRRTVYTKIDPELIMPEEQRVFPDPADPGRVDRLPSYPRLSRAAYTRSAFRQARRNTVEASRPRDRRDRPALPYPRREAWAVRMCPAVSVSTKMKR